MCRTTHILFVLSITFLNNYGNTELVHPWSTSPMRLVDYSRKDIFYDRVISITLNIPNLVGDQRENKHVTTGVLISADRVLTSYNALRNLSKSAEMLKKIFICYVKERQVRFPAATQYRYDCTTVACGRPIIPMKDEEILEEQWHGLDKMHSPLHDLMVLRLVDKLNIWYPSKDFTYEERHSPQHIKDEVWQRAGPLLTDLAGPKDKMQKNIRFVSLGLSSMRMVRRYYGLEVGEYEDSENIQVDCDVWLPRSWGYFHCLANDDNRYAGFASGALLFGEKKLYGVGSFTFFRGKHSILVFTDIRPYLLHIEKTCTNDFDIV